LEIISNHEKAVATPQSKIQNGKSKKWLVKKIMQMRLASFACRETNPIL